MSVIDNEGRSDREDEVVEWILAQPSVHEGHTSSFLALEFNEYGLINRK